jgi:phosphoribosylaminoimidazole (AIR) synthetase
MNAKSGYAADGVDVDLGDLFSKYCAQLNRETYETSRFVDVIDLSRGNFRGPRGFVLKDLPDGCIQTMGADGIGTKVIPIVASGKFETAASNVIAMTAMDITRYGGLPLVFVNILDVASLGKGLDSEAYRCCKQVMRGLAELARSERYVLLNGETAELGVCVGSDDSNARLKFNWGGVMYGVYHPKKMILGDTLDPGQVIMALRDDFRSNGISSARKALRIRYGDVWYNNPAAADDIIAVASPSAQYDRFLNNLHGWMNIHGKQLEPLIRMHLIVHLSGGAFKSKLGEDMLEPQGLSADLDNLFDPPDIMRKCIAWRDLPRNEWYTTVNGGQGALVVIDANKEDAFVSAASAYGIEAKRAGKIKPHQGYNVKITSKFDDGEPIIY